MASLLRPRPVEHPLIFHHRRQAARRRRQTHAKADRPLRGRARPRAQGRPEKFPNRAPFQHLARRIALFQGDMKTSSCQLRKSIWHQSGLERRVRHRVAASIIVAQRLVRTQPDTARVRSDRWPFDRAAVDMGLDREDLTAESGSLAIQAPDSRRHLRRVDRGVSKRQHPSASTSPRRPGSAQMARSHRCGACM